MGHSRKGNTVYKLRFYFISLWLLFLLIFFITIDIPISFSKEATFIGFKELIKRNWLAVVSLLLSVIGLLMCKRLDYEWRGAVHASYKIESVENQNYEYLTFLTTYIIPLISFSLSEVRFVIVLAILLIVIGCIFVKMDLYYGNPTLALMGYRLYRVTISNHPELREIILITRDRLYAGDSIAWRYLDQHVWMAKKVGKEQTHE